jgi:hypothetical protein
MMMYQSPIGDTILVGHRHWPCVAHSTCKLNAQSDLALTANLELNPLAFLPIRKFGPSDLAALSCISLTMIFPFYLSDCVGHRNRR